LEAVILVGAFNFAREAPLLGFAALAGFVVVAATFYFFN
jgi:hypothetical protein